jgi:UDP-N-acetylmuramate--alanine ligase
MHIYFSGVGGVGIGPLAMLAVDAGFKVSGSDLEESEMTKLLVEKGVDVHIGQTKKHISSAHKEDPVDWFVYTAALNEDHPEFSFARDNNIKISKRAEFLNELLVKLNLQLVAISGTHGKTTTTGMLIWLFKKLGIPVSYSVGTTLSFGPPAKYQDDSKYFIYECDEFDRNFLEFNPKLSVITSMDYDHSDTYETPQDYIEAFSQFSKQSETTITWAEVAKRLEDDSHLFVLPDEGDFEKVKLTGLHNKKNAWLAAAAVNRLGLVENDKTDWDKVLNILSMFPGTARRFEKLADNFYTDYAHHPVEIETTINAAKELNKNVVVVYQPHQNIRQHEMLKDDAYKTCFNEAKKVYWLPTYLSREDKKQKTLTPEDLTKDLPKDLFEIAKMNNPLAKKIKQHQKDGDLVIGMSAGDLDAWLRKL